MRRILRECAPAAIDEKLSQLKDPWLQVTSIAVLAPLGSSPTRVALLKTHLLSSLVQPAIEHQLVPVLSALWSEDVANALGEACVVAPFGEGWMPQDMLEVAIDQTPPEVAEKVVLPRIGQAKTEQGNRFLARWAEASIELRH